MKTNPLTQKALTENPFDSGKVSRKMVRERAVEVAAGKGRTMQEVSKSDWEQAKRDLMGEPDLDSKQTTRGSASKSARWDPLPNSIGYKVHVPSGDDEDDEGRSDVERLVEEGGREAALDQMREANREGEINE